MCVALTPAVAQQETMPRVMVILPERIDVDWYWYYYTVESQHLVQTKVEQELLDAGYELVDLEAGRGLPDETSIPALLRTRSALKTARALKAEILVLGQGEAIHASHSVAYGLNVYRSTAEITVKILRVADGKVLAVLDVTETHGAESQRAAAHNTLREAGRSLGEKIVQVLTGTRDISSSK